MGLTNQSTGIGTLKEMFELDIKSSDGIVLALAGNPNTGKTTIFNSLTGLNQHTGNWPGKTVTNAQGNYSYLNQKYVLVDLPGTYSLLANSVEEQVARDFICFGNPNVTIVVADAICLERNLNLVLQVMEISNNVILCVNLMDEARRKKINIDLEKLSALLGIPVVGTSARSGEGLVELKEIIRKVAYGEIKPKPINVKYNKIIEDYIKEMEPTIQENFDDKVKSRWIALHLIDSYHPVSEFHIDNANIQLINNNLLKVKSNILQSKFESEYLSTEKFNDLIVSNIVEHAEYISNQVVSINNKTYNNFDRKIDNILTSKILGIPVMIALLGFIFWLTIEGANYPSKLLSYFFTSLELKLSDILIWIKVPLWLHDMLVLGIFRTLGWVVSVMLPPMAIFFPLFTLLEDLGYLPRIAFNLDYYFKKACAHGKQALTMCMGFGCNAAGVIGCRIIDSPRERLIATITNNFVPCNGRFPTLIALATIFIAGDRENYISIIAALTILFAIITSVFITLIISKLLSVTVLKGLPSSFTLELPPYRKPQIGKIIVHSIFDRSLFVLGRAVSVAAPAGLIIWFLANITIGEISLITYIAQILNPFASLIGLDGYILLSFILGLPANEIVIPILIMSYMSTGSIMELSNLEEMKLLFVENGWTWLTAVCVMIFSLNHWPCGTTLWTIKKETQSWKWTFISFLLPTIVGIILCFIVAQGVPLIMN